MNERLSFAEKILRFNEELSSKSFDLPDGFKIINPFRGENKKEIMEISKAFYGKYYDDTCTRRLILGSSPARRGSAVTGIPFEDACYLQRETGICIENIMSISPQLDFYRMLLLNMVDGENFMRIFI